MSDPCLLAASLLTGGQISTPPPPILPTHFLNNLSALFSATVGCSLQSRVTHQSSPIVETTAPEFSLSPTTPRAIAVFATDQQTSAPTQSTVISPTSGTQLYYQRLAALKAGKIYTSLKPDSFQSVWAKDSQQLTKPSHEQWKRLLAQEAQAMAKGQGTNRLAILVGDSLTLWFPSQLLSNNQFWLNQGISGENSTQILNRLSAFDQTRPHTIYVMAGTNDLRQGVSDRIILDNIRQILHHLRQNHPQSQIIVQSILPTRLSAIPTQRIRNLNQQIALIAQQQGASYLNLYSRFIDNQGQLRRDYTTDGIHLASLGYQAWQEALQYTEFVIAAN